MQFLNDVLYPLLASGSLAALGLGVQIASKRLGVDQASSDNIRIQNAVSNFAGPIVTDLLAGKISLDDVKQGHGVKGLVDYLSTTTLVPALTRLNITPATLGVMLVGKVMDKYVVPIVVPPSNPSA